MATTVKDGYAGHEGNYTLQEWEEYIATTPRKHTGTTTCNICSTVLRDFEFTGVVKDRHRLPVICDSCKAQIAAEVAGQNAGGGGV